MKHFVRKKWGQHFLTDTNLLHKLIRIINPQPEDQILEIGPGEGALTELLASTIKRLVGIEIDQRLYHHLSSNLALKNCLFLNEDFLKVNLSTLPFKENSIRVIGNIPYKITSPIIFKLLESSIKWKDIHLMVQKEVADRLTAKVGSKSYGRLTVMVQAFFHVKIERIIPPEVFVPKPKVYSAFISLHEHGRYRLDNEIYANFSRIVRATFSQRRKMLKNALRNFHFQEKGNIDFTQRAECITIKEFVTLAKLLLKN